MTFHRTNNAFLADESENGYEKVSDKLLYLVHYGEQIISIWFDIVRYADIQWISR